VGVCLLHAAKPIIKLFRTSGSHIILVYSDPCADTLFQGKPFGGAIYTWGWEKLAIFD